VLGHSLFANNCTACHGSDARGAPGFPNLTDPEWLHGGSPAEIVETITHGREGIMPALGAALGDQGVNEVAAYVLSLSGRQEPPLLVAAGKSRFLLCAGCHGADGTGNQAIGAPNLHHESWLYGGTDAAVRKSIKDGRHGRMPPHAWLGDDKIKLLAAYVYSLSHTP
jgi:cytochrome c oxidase cbb3-type subunit 3